MKMFHKLQAFIHNAVDALASELPPQETFVFNWKAVTNYFIEATDEKVPVQGTNIPYHLEQMITVLREEEENATGGTMGPCLEYLLQHKILETLHTLGRADCPPGMKQQVLKFFANLLAKIKQPLLPHINVYRPVHRLIRLCGEVRAAPTENEEIQFLCTVCAKLRQDPYLVNFFLETNSQTHKAPGITTSSLTSNPNEAKLYSSVTTNQPEKYKLSPSAHVRHLGKCKMPSSALANQPDNCKMSSSSALANQPGEAKIFSSTIAQPFQLFSSSSPSSGIQSNTAKVSSCSPICAGDQCTEHLLLCGTSDPPLQSSSGGSFPVSTEVPGSSGMLTPSRGTPPTTEDEIDKPKEPEKPEYTLVNSLLTFTKSEDSRVGVKACEGLLLCASLPEDHAATVIILYTAFCEVMADRLKSLFEALPKDIDPVDISTVVAKWGLDHQADDEDVSSFRGKRQLISFLSWLDYIDNLCKEAHKLVAKALAVGLRERFLQAVIGPSLVQPSELGVIMTTAVLTRCVRLISSPHILNELCSFLLGERTEPELPSHEGEHKLCQTLIERCDHLSDELSIETLKLFEALIHKPCDSVLNILILRNLASRKYYAPPVVTNGNDNVDGKEVDGTLNGPADGDNLSPPPSPMAICTPPGTPDLEKTFANPDAADEADQRDLEKIINCFLLLVPDEVKSSIQAGDTGYDTYLKDAHKQYNERNMQTLHFNWPMTAVSARDESEETFYQGSFLSMLFRKLQRILDQPYEVNLQVTSVVALLAQFQHPQLHELLLNVSIPLAPGCSSLYTTLENILIEQRHRPFAQLVTECGTLHRLSLASKVVQDLRGRIQRITNFQKHVVAVRRQLMGVATSPEHKSTAQSNLFEAVIVLEEFCKELAAIAFVKATSRLHSR